MSKQVHTEFLKAKLRCEKAADEGYRVRAKVSVDTPDGPRYVERVLAEIRDIRPYREQGLEECAAYGNLFTHAPEMLEQLRTLAFRMKDVEVELGRYEALSAVRARLRTEIANAEELIREASTAGSMR